MKKQSGNILALNGGSSSIKFALYKQEKEPVIIFSGALKDIGGKNCSLTATQLSDPLAVPAKDHAQAVKFLLDWLEKQPDFDWVVAIGQRVVHGMNHHKPEVITPALLYELKGISAYDPDHLPDEIKLIALCRKRYPAVTQVACFDTAFHANMPPVAQLIAIPRRYRSVGIKRYGFHGLSYAYLMEELGKLRGRKAASGKIVLAHLGSGASLCAVKNGSSMDTSMGFTPTSGLPMSTRTGDLDPGVAAYLMQHERLSPAQFNRMINHESGLLGISGNSAAMENLLKTRHQDPQASEAVELFCYQARKYIGSYAAVLDGLDTLVFSGGIGENAPEIREMICGELKFLGIKINKIRNKKNELIISADSSRVTVCVIPTNEELMMARLVRQIIKQKK